MSVPAPGLSGLLWPIHPKPLPDELLSCWLIRIARGFGTTVDRFCEQVWPEPVWGGDFDLSVGKEILRLMAVRTGTPYDQVAQMPLTVYADHLSAPAPTLFDAAARGKGLRFCQMCLDKDAIPYYRRAWRLSFVTVCALHGARLATKCAGCGRGTDLQAVPLDEAESLAVCFACTNKISGARAVNIHPQRVRRAGAMQQRLYRLLVTLNECPAMDLSGDVVRLVAANASGA